MILIHSRCWQASSHRGRNREEKGAMNGGKGRMIQSRTSCRSKSLPNSQIKPGSKSGSMKPVTEKNLGVSEERMYQKVECIKCTKENRGSGSSGEHAIVVGGEGQRREILRGRERKKGKEEREREKTGNNERSERADKETGIFLVLFLLTVLPFTPLPFPRVLPLPLLSLSSLSSWFPLSFFIFLPFSPSLQWRQILIFYSYTNISLHEINYI